MSGQIEGQIADLFDAEIKQRGLTNFEVAIDLGVTEKTVYRWRNAKTDLRLRNRRLVLDWIRNRPTAQLEEAV